MSTVMETEVETTKITAVIAGPADPIPMGELGRFFVEFNEMYVRASLLMHELPGNLPPDGPVLIEAAVQRMKESAPGVGFLDGGDHYERRDVELDLEIIDISRENPIELVLEGSIVALCIAVILSGGTFKLDKSGLQVKLPPLGEGIRKLRTALGAPPRNKEEGITVWRTNVAQAKPRKSKKKKD